MRQRDREDTMAVVEADERGGSLYPWNYRGQLLGRDFCSVKIK